MATETARLARDIVALQRQVKALSRTPQLANSSVEDGAIDVNAGGQMVASIGLQFDGTAGAVPLSGPEPPAPSVPAVTGILDGITVSWDGYFTDELGRTDITVIPPSDFTRIEVHASAEPDFEPVYAETLRGTIETPRGADVVITPVPPGTWYVKLVTRTAPGKASEPSGQATGSPAAALSEIDQMIGDLTANLEVAAGRVTTVEGDISTLQTDTLPALQSGLADAEANITSATGRVAAAEGEISTLKTTTLPALQSNVDAASSAASAAASKADAAKAAADGVVSDVTALETLTGGWTAAGTTEIDGGKLKTDSVTAREIAGKTITAAEIKALALTSASGIFGTMDASVINAGTIAAARLDAATVRAKFIEAGKITATDLVAGTLTSASGVFGTIDASVINAGTLAAARLDATAVRAKFLEAGKITATDLVAGTLTSASGVFGTMDASVINAGTIAAARLDAATVRAKAIAAGKIVASEIDTANLTADTAFISGVRANVVTADAFIGKTFTGGTFEGPTVRSSATPWTDGGWQLDGLGLRFWKPGSTEATPTLNAKSATGDIGIIGALSATSTTNEVAGSTTTTRTVTTTLGPNGVTGRTSSGTTTGMPGISWTGPDLSKPGIGSGGLSDLKLVSGGPNQDSRTIVELTPSGLEVRAGTWLTDFFIGSDASGPRIWSMGIYNRSYDTAVKPDGARLAMVTTQGTLGTLARRIDPAYMPYERGTVSVPGSLAANGTWSKGVTFTSGQFSSPPQVLLTPGHLRATASVTNLTKDGFTLNIANWTGSAFPASAADCTWVAML